MLLVQGSVAVQAAVTPQVSLSVVLSQRLQTSTVTGFLRINVPYYGPLNRYCILPTFNQVDSLLREHHAQLDKTHIVAVWRLIAWL